MDEHRWEDLLLALEEGHVVPIVGRDLAVVETPEGPRLYHRIVAERLAAELNVSPDRLPQEYDTNDVVCAYEHFHGDPMAINPRVVRILRGLEVPVPEPLRLLAEIPSFRVFINLSFDTLLEEAIASVRGRPPAVVAFPPASNLTDFDETLLDQHGSLVFHLLGRVSASASFAITEGQMLEQMYDFMSGPRRPEKLIALLQESHLLLIGVGFPDWLARFLLRLSRTKPLWDSRFVTEIIAGTEYAQKEFGLFLSNFSPQQSSLFTEGPPEYFVRELHRRWFERHQATETVDARVDVETEKPIEMEAGAIFVSYASEDREEAFRLTDSLTAAGLDVWVDRRIQPGGDYREIIERNIRECCAFVPLLSRHTQTDDERWFRKEWAQACDRARLYFGTDRSLLFPVVVDDTPNNELNELRREIFGRSAVRAVQGDPPQGLFEQLDRAQKTWRKQFART